MNFDALNDYKIELISNENSFQKIRVLPQYLCDLLSSLKNYPEFAFDRLSTIIAVDLEKEIELIYDLFSTSLNLNARVSVLLDKKSPNCQSVVDIYKSAYFDECEIYDLFGVKFDKNPDLKRLFMPKGWIGHPLRKDYVQKDERLAWND